MEKKRRLSFMLFVLLKTCRRKPVLDSGLITAVTFGSWVLTLCGANWPVYLDAFPLVSARPLPTCFSAVIKMLFCGQLLASESPVGSQFYFGQRLWDPGQRAGYFKLMPFKELLV